MIELRELSLAYRMGEQTLTALKKVDLHIRRGEMVAILGPSGSGKSTLLYILGCLLQPTGGGYRFNGYEVPQLNNEQLADLRSRTIGFVFQQFHLLPRANVLNNVLLGCQYNRPREHAGDDFRARARELIQKVGLEGHIRHFPNQLSGGQQQRVAIARALINNPDLVLADEPTGNLDSKSAGQILDLLQEIHREGRTVIIITHDRSVAERCDRVVTIFDGVLKEDQPTPVTTGPAAVPPVTEHLGNPWREHLRTALQNLLRNKTRSFLTMIGVTIGIAAVLATITLGDFTRAKILEGYESLGINKLVVRAYPRWNLRASEIEGVKFQGVSNAGDILPMRRLFPDIALISPVTRSYVQSVQFGGQTDDQVSVLGVSEEYFPITKRRVILGHPFSNFHITNHSPVCVIGYDIAQKLFRTLSPLDHALQIQGSNDNNYSCTVMGVLAPQSSNNEWFKPNEQVLVPVSFLSIMSSQWNSQSNEFDLQMRAGSSADDLGVKIKQFFNSKYGRSAQVTVDADDILVAQMRKFLNLFTMLLAGVAFISLAVGGVGITNMMLVSVAERFKEIGLRKALGARDQEIRMQFLVEALILCLVSGLAGVLMGIVGYHTVLYLASQLFPKVHFEWIFNFPAMFVALACILGVGIASGLAPALRAEKLEVVEALRSE